MRLLLVALLLALTSSAFAQDKMQMMDDVARYQQQLKSQKTSERDEAEKKLLEIGEFVLDHLEPIEPDDTTDYRNRLNRVRTTLEKIAVSRVTKPSKLEFADTKMTVAELLVQFKEQTGNDVILDPETQIDVPKKQIELSSTKLNFWDALNELMEQAELRIEPYAGETGQLALAEQFQVPGVDEADQKTEQFIDYSNIMRFEITRLTAQRNFQNPNMSFGSFSMLVRWEPRIQPIAIDLQLSDLVITDEFDQTYQPGVEAGAQSAIVTPEIPQLEFGVETPIFDRQVEELKSIKGSIEAVLPGRVETFKFKEFNDLEAGTSQTKAGATVTYDGVSKNEDLWSVRVTLSFDDEANALESHQAWAFNNELYILDKEGNREDFISYNTIQQGNNSISLQYLFIEEPKDRSLYYQTPAAVVKVQIPFEIKGIPLP